MTWCPSDLSHLPSCRGEAFYADKDTLGVIEHKDSKEAVDRMVNDLEKQ